MKFTVINDTQVLIVSTPPVVKVMTPGPQGPSSGAGGASKANKVVGAVSGDFASLDASGDLVDSGTKPADFLAVADATVGSAPDTVVKRGPSGEGNFDYLTVVNQITLGQVEILPYDDTTIQVVGTIKGDGSGLTGVNKPYTHIQNSAATVWTINHNLGRYPSVTTVDTLGRPIGGEVLYVTANQVTVTFSAPLSGTAYLN